MTESRFSIGELVYHATPNTEQGIIVDIYYSHAEDKYIYLIKVGWDGEFICKEHELIEHKLF